MIYHRFSLPESHTSYESLCKSQQAIRRVLRLEKTMKFAEIGGARELGVEGCEIEQLGIELK
jgi:hypothetical protein